MRKMLLTTAIVLVSACAQAAGSLGVTLASADDPVAAEQSTTTTEAATSIDRPYANSTTAPAATTTTPAPATSQAPAAATRPSYTVSSANAISEALHDSGRQELHVVFSKCTFWSRKLLLRLRAGCATASSPRLGDRGRADRHRAPSAARVQAASILLDRGWGKPPQPHTGEDDKDIRITVRNITESRS